MHFRKNVIWIRSQGLPRTGFCLNDHQQMILKLLATYIKVPRCLQCFYAYIVNIYVKERNLPFLALVLVYIVLSVPFSAYSIMIYSLSYIKLMAGDQRLLIVFFISNILIIYPLTWNVWTNSNIRTKKKEQEGPEGPGSLTWGKGQRSQWSK